MTVITSPDNPRVREIARLMQSSRDRRKAGLTLLDGVHLVAAYLQHVGLPAQVIVSSSSRHEPEIAALLEKLLPLEPLELRDGLFRTLSSVDTPTGIIGVIAAPERRRPPEEAAPCVLLEGIQDPGNLGSILRSTAAANLGEVYLSRHSVDAWSPRVLRAAMGAHFLLDIYEGVDLGELARQFTGRVIATHRNATQSIYDEDLTGDVALVFGNEGAGISSDLLGAVGAVVTIPMPGSTESLNVAASAAICLFERVRQIHVAN